MSYQKNTWQNGDIITAQKLNNIEEGIVNSTGYSCSSKITEYFNSSETTSTFYNGGYKSDVFQLSDDLSADEITVVFNGTEYIVEKKDFYGTIYYGATFQGGFIFENIPFCIFDVKNRTAQLVTENTGTYSLVISATKENIETSECFEKAVKKHSIKNVVDSSLANGAVVEGNVKGNVASGFYSHAEGVGTTASGQCSHAEGYSTTASGNQAHAEGCFTTASGEYSHAQNYNTIALSQYQTALGKLNIQDSNNTYVFIMAPDGNKIQAKMFKDLVILDEEMPCIIYYDANSGDKVSKTHIFKINNANMEKIDDKYIFKYLKKIKKRRIKRELFSEYPSKEPKYIKGMKYIIGRDFDKEINDEQNNILLCVYTDSKSDLENNYFNILGNLTEKYQSDPEKKIKFFILNYKYNEPRDLEFTDKIFPKVYLYTNAMKEKKIWRFKPKNETEICYEEMETFLKDKLKWKDEKDKQEFNKDKKKDKSNKNEDL